MEDCEISKDPAAVNELLETAELHKVIDLKSEKLSAYRDKIEAELRAIPKNIAKYQEKIEELKDELE